MKKIIYIIDHLRIGGVQTLLLARLKHSDRGKYSQIVYSLTERTPLGQEIEKLGVTVNYLNLNEKLKTKKWFAVIKELYKTFHRQKPDLLETHLFWSRFLGGAAGRLAGVRRIIGIQQGELYYQGWTYQLAHRLVFLLADKITTCSFALSKEIIRQQHIPARKLLVVHNAIEINELIPIRNISDLRRKFNLADNEIVVGSVGTLGRGVVKGMDYLIRAVGEVVKIHPHIKLLIVGDGELKKDLENLARDLGLTEKVIFLGLRRDVPDFLEAIDIFALASPFEPFGIAVIEAMMMKKPVIGSNSGGIPEIVDDNINGLLVPPRNHQAFARAIIRLIENPELRKQLGEAARKKVIEKFSIQEYIKKMEELYKKL